jgi:hypothetical protein
MKDRFECKKLICRSLREPAIISSNNGDAFISFDNSPEETAGRNYIIRNFCDIANTWIPPTQEQLNSSPFNSKFQSVILFRKNTNGYFFTRQRT